MVRLIMKRRTKFIIIMVLVVLASGCKAVPSDETLISNFNNHQEEFQELLAMFQSDEKLMEISGEKLSPEGAISQERAQKYQSLLKELKLERVSAATVKKEDIIFEVYVADAKGKTATKGYEYWAKEIPDYLAVVDNLDEDFAKELEKGESLSYYGFRGIEGHWYLYYSVGGS